MDVPKAAIFRHNEGLRRGPDRAKIAPMRSLSHPSPPSSRTEPVAFTRSELTRILGVYGYFVAAGDWRDYAIDCLSDAAVFSIFRRASEMPLYRIEKRPKLARKQGAFAIVSMSGAVLKRGKDLGSLLRYFDRQKLKLASSN